MHPANRVDQRLLYTTFEAFLTQWRGEEGQRAFVWQAVQLEERHTAEFEPRFDSIEVPVQVIWGEADTWLDLDRQTACTKRFPARASRRWRAPGTSLRRTRPRRWRGS